MKNILTNLLFFVILLATFTFADTLSDYSRARKLFNTEQKMESYILLRNISQTTSEVQDFALYYYAKLSSREDSIPIYEQLLKMYPDFIFAQSLRNEILDYSFTKEAWGKLSSAEVWNLAKIYNSRARWADSKKAFSYWFKNYPSADKVIEAKYLSGINATKLGEYAAAYSFFADVINSSDKQFSNLARIQKAKLIYVQKGIDAGIEAYLHLRENYSSNLYLMETVLLELASLYRINDRYAEAEECYVTYLKMFPERQTSDEIRFQLGRMLYISGNYLSAEKYFYEVVEKEKVDQTVGPVSLFILTLLPETTPIRKKELYERLFKEYPWTYYGHLAARCLGKSFRREPDVLNKDIDIKMLSQRAAFFIELGDYETAALFLRPKFFANTSNLALALYLIELYEKNNDQYNALGISDVVWRNHQNKGKLYTMPTVFWEKANPLYFWEDVNKESQKYGLDPYMVLALMRQESRFNAKAISKSNARGLMQLMLPTAKAVARGFNLDKYDLDDPSTNIMFGVNYFAEMTKRHPNNKEYVLSCYNAGPNRTAVWVSENRQLQTEDFIEQIPYTETRNYVKVVMRNYWNYRDLYAKNVY